MKKNSVFHRFWYFINVCCALLLLLASLSSLLTWEVFSFFSFLSLGVPYLVVANLYFLFFWTFKRKKQLRVSLVVLILGFLIHGPFFKFYSGNKEIAANEVSLLSLNCHELRGVEYNKLSEYGTEVLEFINEQDSDILSFQEFDAGETKRYEKYPHTYVNYIFGETQRVVQAIMSKHRIINKGTLDFPNSHNNAIYADIVIQKDTIRVYNVHFESFSVRPRDIKNEETKRLFGRLNTSFQKQQNQAQLLKEHKEKSPYRNIVSGDFNNTQFSNVYRTVKGDMSDSFLEKGSGFGATYSFNLLPFRIDFILVDSAMPVMAYRNFNVNLSDHEPVMASFKIVE